MLVESYEGIFLAAAVLILPGIGNSGPEHWQSIWERMHPEFVRIQQRNWNRPTCADWVTSIEDFVSRAGPGAVLVAHSLACLAVAHWSITRHSPVKAALLVAVPDPGSPMFPVEACGFSDTPSRPFVFKSTVVVSDNDPYGSAEHAEGLAAAWGSQTVHVGNCGHINAGSRLGAWRDGYRLLDQLLS